MNDIQNSNANQNEPADNRAAAPVPAESVDLPTYALNDPPLPDDPEAALEQVKELDRSDAERDRDSFALKIRRAMRMQALFDAEIHKKLKVPFETFVNVNFNGGYDAWTRFRALGRVQRQLHEWKLPLITTEAQARVLAPRLDDRGIEAKLRELLAAHDNTYPSSREMTKTLRSKRKTAKPRGDEEKHLVALLQSPRLLVDERAHLQSALDRIRALQPRKVTKGPRANQADFGFGAP